MSKQPHLLVEEGELADVALLPGDPGRVDRIAERVADELGLVRVSALLPRLVDGGEECLRDPNVDFLHLAVCPGVAVGAHML